MLKRIWAVMQKEFIQTLRDRRTLGIMLALPLVQLLLFAYAISINVSHVPTVVADQSMDPASREFLDALTASNYFDVVATARSQAEVIRAIDEGRAQAGVVIPPGFASHVAQEDAQALILIDGSDLLPAHSGPSLNIENMYAAHTATTTAEMVQRAQR